MKKHRKVQCFRTLLTVGAVLGVFCGSSFGSIFQRSFWSNLPLSVYGATEGGMLSVVTDTSSICPIPDSDGKYLLKSDGFYCVSQEGSLHQSPAVHYFDHFEIDGTVFNGYYYHDENGKFKAADSHLVEIAESAAPVSADKIAQEWTAGIYMVGNLGKLSAASQVRFFEQEQIGGKVLDGYYFFDDRGRLCQEGGICYVGKMEVSERSFEGYYYFDEKTGALASGGNTAEGFNVASDGSIKELKAPGIKNLEKALKELLAGYEGEWSVYVKDLGAKKKFSINNKAMTSASLIKAFTMAASYDNMENIKKHEGSILKADPDSDTVANKIFRLMENMVTYSDNESFNEMVRLQTASGQFRAGARSINRYLKEVGYEDTAVMHTLSPSETEPTGFGSNTNTTSVEDCGRLLEKIYRKKCVDKESSEKMLSLLLAQDTRSKIPGGLSEEIQVANKTGENDLSQHDIAIVYGERTNYILCVMSEGGGSETEAVERIRKISSLVYYYLNW